MKINYPKAPKFNKSIFDLKDSDKDNVPNALDCEPYNPKKQGIVHRAGAAIARKLGDEEKAKRFEEKGEKIDAERAEAKERYSVAREEARVKEREARTQRKEDLIRTAPERKEERKRKLKEGAKKFVKKAGEVGRASVKEMG